MLWTDEGLRTKEETLPLSEYPRPQLKRSSFLCLNGEWDFEISKSEDKPSHFSKKIRVPFSPETPLSGIQSSVTSKDVLHYRRYFDVDDLDETHRYFLHLDAVDQVADIYVNGEFCSHHEGGYDSIEVECRHLHKTGNELYVRVKDDTDSPIFPRGKQLNRRGGIWYTPTSGIWQTVWLERTPKDRIFSLRITPDFDNRSFSLSLSLDGTFDEGEVEVFFRGRLLKRVALDASLNLSIPLEEEFHPWSPDEPALYDLSIRVNEDRIASYFAMRKFGTISWKGHPVFALNNRPLFLNGLLDQGYYPDGGLTPPSDRAMLQDIQDMRKLGFNMLRKHIKIEPLRFYYHCDVSGMIVIQDLVNGGAPYKKWLIVAGPFLCPKWKDEKIKVQRRFGRGNPQSKECFVEDLKRTVSHLYNVPCIAIWTIFNEGWGQFDAKKMTSLLKGLDSTRLIDSTSGWADQGCGDFSSHHIYFRKISLKSDPKRILSLSEFGGYSLFLKDHSFSAKSFGYKKKRDVDELTASLVELYRDEVIPFIDKEGLSVAVLTQWSDVEDEVNGLVTYDRKVLKVREKEMIECNKEVVFHD